MKAIRFFGSNVAAVVLAALLAGNTFAQAPVRPQSGQPQQSAPTPQTQTPATPSQKQPPPDAGVTIAVDVPVVTIDVVATTQRGDILTGLKKENFRVLDNGVPQTLTNFAPNEAPITVVMLLEFSKLAYGWIAYKTTEWADAFFPNLQQKDW